MPKNLGLIKKNNKLESLKFPLTLAYAAKMTEVKGNKFFSQMSQPVRFPGQLARIFSAIEAQIIGW